MPRPLRVDIADGWYHAMSRRFECGGVFGERRNYAHFIELLEEMVTRYGMKAEACVLLTNRYHLLLHEYVYKCGTIRTRTRTLESFFSHIF